MSRYNQVAQRVLKVHSEYRGELPLSQWLRDFFKSNKNMGSTDRKLFSALLYGTYRWLGARDVKATERDVELSACLQPLLPPGYIAYLKEKDPVYAKILSASSIQEKLEMIASAGWDSAAYFPAEDFISEKLEKEGFIATHLFPKYVWVRVRQQHTKEVTSAFTEAGYSWEAFSDTCLRMNGHYPLHTMDVFLRGYFEIQDKASQETGRYMHPKPGDVWFDCCVGSGGKSLMLMDISDNLSLSVNDTRGEMLDELRDRFEKAEMPLPKVMQTDLTAGIYEGLGPFDGIIADLPCTGSGTWGRSPERMSLFRAEQIQAYAERQKAIIHQVAKVIKPGAPIFYITCSVYADENENNVEQICHDNGLACSEQYYLNFHQDGADTLFLAVLSK